MSKSVIAIFASFVLLVDICHPVASAQVNACQRQCTSKNGSCSSVRSNPDKYDMCVAKCTQQCVDCNTGVDQRQPQLALNLYTGGQTCPANATLTQISSALTPKLSQLGLQNPDVHSSCQNGYISVLIWTTPPANQCAKTARASAQLPSDIAFTPFGFYIDRTTLAGLAHSSFAANKSLQTVPGYPSIHLTSLSLQFLNQATVNLDKFWCKKSVCSNLSPTNGATTTVQGHEDRTTPSTDFTVTILDVLTPRSGCTPVTDPNCGCLSASREDVSLLDEVVVAVSGFVAAGVSAVLPIGPIVDIWTGDLDAAFHQPGGGVQGGAACTIYQSLPDEIALPETGGPILPTEALARVPSLPVVGVQTGSPVKKNKLVISYSAPRISDTAVTFVGVDQLKPRTPAVQIQGLNELTVNRSSFKTTSNYTVLPEPLQAQDFYGALTYAWTADSAQVHFASANQQQTDIEFSTDPNMQPGQTATQTLHVNVTDSEGSSATATLSIQILKLATNPPPPGPSVPGRCKQNPYAKGCPPTHPF